MVMMVVEQCGGPNNVVDLQKQPFYRFLQRTYIAHPIALGILLYAFGGLPFLVWGMVSISLYFYSLACFESISNPITHDREIVFLHGIN